MKCTNVIAVEFVSIDEAKKYCLNDSSCGGVYDIACNEIGTILLCTTNTIYWTNDTIGCIYQKVKGETWRYKYKCILIKIDVFDKFLIFITVPNLDYPKTSTTTESFNDVTEKIENVDQSPSIGQTSDTGNAFFNGKSIF